MSSDIIASPVLTPGVSVDSYVRTVSAIPVLSAEREKELANQFITDENLDSARQLVLANLRFVVYVARSYSGYGLSQADLIQEGNLGLMKAIKRFDPDYGVRLVSFAVHWIKAEIHEFILRNWRIVKVATTKSQRKLFFNLRSKKKTLSSYPIRQNAFQKSCKNTKKHESITSCSQVSPYLCWNCSRENAFRPFRTEKNSSKIGYQW